MKYPKGCKVSAEAGAFMKVELLFW
jgi:hypothetical protein